MTAGRDRTLQARRAHRASFKGRPRMWLVIALGYLALAAIVATMGLCS